MFVVDDRYVITGIPGKRDWMANLKADPCMIVHVPIGAEMVDLDATSRAVTDEAFRRTDFTSPHISWYATQAQHATLVAAAPMIEVVFAGAD